MDYKVIANDRSSETCDAVDFYIVDVVTYNTK